MTSKFYLTTPIYYVNDVPHIGHAYTTIAADVIARYYRQKLSRQRVFFLTGTDEHGQKVAQAAKEAGLSPKQYVDSIAPRFKEAWKLLNIDYDYFIRTTDPKHERVVSEIIQKVYDAGYIYPGTYKGLYCVGCEKFLTESEVVNGKCPLHPNKEPLLQEEKNYFIKLKELSKVVLEKIENGEYEILPEDKKKEIVSRIKQGVEDISISRAGVPWGIPLPWDKTQTIYVWVDALINYYSATRSIKGKEKFWPADIHFVGKDILWFHAVIWQAILIACGIELPKTIFAHGFFTIDGAKMSKSLGNAIPPRELVEKYGVDGARYLVLSAYPFGSDGDISLAKFKEEYNAHLANGIGNLISRVAKLCENSNFEFSQEKILKFDDLVEENLKNYHFDEALKNLFDRFVSGLDSSINKEEPWNLTGDNLKEFLTGSVSIIRNLAFNLALFLPETSEKIEKQFLGPKIKSEPPLFPRL